MSIYIRNVSINIESLGSEAIKAIATMENKGDYLAKKGYFKIEATVSLNNLEIKSVEDSVLDGSFPVCSEAVSKLKSIEGIIIDADYNKKVMNLIGGKDGCTHMVELLIEIGRCVHLAYNCTRLKEGMGIKDIIQDYQGKGIPCCLEFSNSIGSRE